MTEIVLLTKEDCHLCDQAKGVLARLRGEYDLHIREVGLESEEGKSLALESAALFPPIVLLNGETFSYGRLSERKLRKALP